jgi:hypothetical protein
MFKYNVYAIKLIAFYYYKKKLSNNIGAKNVVLQTYFFTAFQFIGEDIKLL